MAENENATNVPGNSMRLADKFQKLKNGIKLHHYHEHTEDRGNDVDIVEAEHGGKVIGRFVSKNGNLIESHGSEDSQESGTHEDIAKKLKVQNNIIHTKVEQVAEKAHEDAYDNTIKNKDNQKADNFKKPNGEHGLDNCFNAEKAKMPGSNKKPVESTESLDKALPSVHYHMGQQSESYDRGGTPQAPKTTMQKTNPKQLDKNKLSPPLNIRMPSEPNVLDYSKMPKTTPEDKVPNWKKRLIAEGKPFVKAEEVVGKPLAKKWQTFMESVKNKFADPLQKPTTLCKAVTESDKYKAAMKRQGKGGEGSESAAGSLETGRPWSAEHVAETERELAFTGRLSGDKWASDYTKHKDAKSALAAKGEHAEVRKASAQARSEDDRNYSKEHGEALNKLRHSAEYMHGKRILEYGKRGDEGSANIRPVVSGNSTIADYGKDSNNFHHFKVRTKVSRKTPQVEHDFVVAPDGKITHLPPTHSQNARSQFLSGLHAHHLPEATAKIQEHVNAKPNDKKLKLVKSVQNMTKTYSGRVDTSKDVARSQAEVQKHPKFAELTDPTQKSTEPTIMASQTKLGKSMKSMIETLRKVDEPIDFKKKQEGKEPVSAIDTKREAIKAKGADYKKTPRSEESNMHNFWLASRKQQHKLRQKAEAKKIPLPDHKPTEPTKKSSVDQAAKKPTQVAAKTPVIENVAETSLGKKPLSRGEGLVKDQKPKNPAAIDPSISPQHLPSAENGLEQHLGDLQTALSENQKKLAAASQKAGYGPEVPKEKREKAMKMAERTMNYLKQGIELTKVAIQSRDSENPNWSDLVGTGNPKVNQMGIVTFGNTLPGHNCPGRGGCGDGSCYGMNGQQAMGNALSLRARNAGLIHRKDFVQGAIHALKNMPKHLNVTTAEDMYNEIKDHPRFKNILLSQPVKTKDGMMRFKVKAGDIVRWHDTGDILNEKHLDDMVQIAKAFPEKKFYAYTKSMHLPLEKLRALPNFNVIQSFGGEHNDKIDTTKPHAKFFDSLESAHSAGYTPVWWHDWPAASGVNNLALVPHGSRKKEIDVEGFNKPNTDKKLGKSEQPATTTPAWLSYDQPDAIAQSAAMGLKGKMRAMIMVSHHHDKYEPVEKSGMEYLSKPPVSEAQRRAMYAAAAGKSTLDIPKKVGKEFTAADKGGKLPEKKTQKSEVVTNKKPMPVFQRG